MRRHKAHRRRSNQVSERNTGSARACYVLPQLKRAGFCQVVRVLAANEATRVASNRTPIGAPVIQYPDMRPNLGPHSKGNQLICSVNSTVCDKKLPVSKCGENVATTPPPLNPKQLLPHT